MVPTMGARRSESTNGRSANYCTSGICTDPRNDVSEAEAGALICKEADAFLVSALGAWPKRTTTRIPPATA